MRLLLTADLQLQNYTEFSSLTEHGYNSRLFNLLSGLTDIISSATYCPDKLVIAGDLFNNKAALETDLLHLVHASFNTWKSYVREIIILLGNHDTAFLNPEIHSLSQFDSFCRVITISGLYDDIVWIPWQASREQIIQDIELLSGRAPYLIGHFTVTGAETNGNVLTGIDPNMPALQTFKYVLLGDIHKTQVLGSNILYLGSPAQNNFGEEGNSNYVWLLDTESGELEDIPTNFPQFKTCSTVDEAAEFRKKGYFVRVKATSREEAAKGNEAGLRVEQDFVESVADGLRGQVNNAEEAVGLYALSNDREDLALAGTDYLNKVPGSRTVPAIQLHIYNMYAKNFMLFDELRLEFDQTGLIVINGVVVSDTATLTSNGAGKTSIFEAIYYALYGVTLSYGTKRDLTIREGEKSNEVMLQFFIKDADKMESYVQIERKRPGGTKLWLNHRDITCNGDPLTQKKINELIGEPQFFLRVALLALHAHPSFLQLSDPDKKQFVDEFSGLDVFSKARDLVATDVAKLDLDAHRQEVEETRLTERATLTQAHLSTAVEELKTFEEEVKRQAQEREATIKGLKDELAALKEPVRPPDPPFIPPQMEKPQLHVVDTTHISERIQTTEAALVEIDAAFQQLLNTHRERLQPLIDQRGSYTADIEKLQRNIGKEKCPTCERPFENVLEANQHINEKIDIARSRRQKVEEELETLRAEQTTEADAFRKDITVLQTELSLDRSKVQLIKDRTFMFERELNAYNRVLAQTEIDHKDRCNDIDRRYKAACQVYELSKQRLEDQLKSFKAVVTPKPTNIENRIKELQEQATNIGAEVKALKERSTALIKERTDLEFWLTGFGNRGCKSLLYTSLIDRLNQELVHICNVISGGTMVLRLLPYTENARGNQTEKISLEVVNHLGSSHYEGNSLGEQTRINIAVNMALRRTLQLFSGYTTTLLFVDEPFQGVDRGGKEAIYEYFRNEAANCCVMVTDNAFDVKGTIDAQLWTVRKENKISKLCTS